jgi:hypothetical protein
MWFCVFEVNRLYMTFIKVSVLKNSIREKVQTSELSEYMMTSVMTVITDNFVAAIQTPNKIYINM